MKELKNKEVIAGFIVIIILGIIALALLVKRELKSNSGFSKNEATIEKEYMAEQEPISIEVPEEEEVVMEEAAQKVPQKEEESETVLETAKMTEDSGDKDKKEKKRYTLYTVLGDKKYKSQSMKQRRTEDGQLKELYDYWDAYHLEAVGDLIRLERIQKISEELEGTGKFYYYGSTDSLGRPSGKGLAVYENNAYYFGSWKEGLREGKGMWLQVAIYNEENKYANLGVVEHSYNGAWKKDLPNGEGQEHFSYDYQVLKEDYLTYNFALANVLGNFKDGYYHGEMYIMTADEEGNTTDWTGICEEGVWEPIMKGNTTDAVWETLEKDQQGNPSYHYMFPRDNAGFGILGLMK